MSGLVPSLFFSPLSPVRATFSSLNSHGSRIVSRRSRALLRVWFANPKSHSRESRDPHSLLLAVRRFASTLT